MARSRSKPDRGHALEEASRLDHSLLLLLLTKLDLPHISQRRKRTLDTFAKRRRLALDRGLIDAATNKDLKAINDVRVIFAHAELPVRFTSAPVRIKARKFRGWKPRASARRLFDQAVGRAEVAINSQINALIW